MTRRRWVSPQEYAISQRKREQRRQEDLAREQRFQDTVVGNLMGLADDERRMPRDAQDHVGWYRRQAGTIRGTDHLCLTCQPGKPAADFGKVLRLMVAAICPCGRCGKRLDEVDLDPQPWKNEK